MVSYRCVVVGDVIDSRESDRREQLERDLIEGLDNVNNTFQEDIVADFVRLKGIDEIAGVLRTPANAYGVIRSITERIHPVSIRFAVVFGAVDIAPNSGDVATMDGPAFHRADELLSRIEAQDRLIGIDIHTTGVDSRCRSDGRRSEDSSLCWDLLADHLDLIQLWKSRWTDRQVELVRAYRSYDSVVAVADEIGVTPQTVSESLRRSRAQTILDMEERVGTVFEQFAAEVVGDVG